MSENNFTVCRCEEVSYQTLKETAQTYGCSSRELKLRTRAGMGICGGRTCRPMVEAISKNVGKASDFASSEEVPLKYQPPVRPIGFDFERGEYNE